MFRKLSYVVMTLFLGVPAMAGEYVGKFKAEFLDDGRKVALIDEFGFRDDGGKSWMVPAGTIVDGASIPRPLWAVIGGPFEGKYRNASVIHDYGCDKETEVWHQVHRVFYEAMLTSGVDAIQAKIMYLAVYHFGPRWSLEPDKTVTICNPDGTCYATLKSVDVDENDFDQEDFQRIEAFVKSQPYVDVADPNTTLTQITGEPSVK